MFLAFQRWFRIENRTIFKEDKLISAQEVFDILLVILKRFHALPTPMQFIAMFALGVKATPVTSGTFQDTVR